MNADETIVTGAAIAGLMRAAFAGTFHAAVFNWEARRFATGRRKRTTSTPVKARTPAKARAAVKLSAFLARAHLDNAVTEARIRQ